MLSKLMAGAGMKPKLRLKPVDNMATCAGCDMHGNVACREVQDIIPCYTGEIGVRQFYHILHLGEVPSTR
jgi:hypothetical protein